jgi:putative membrane protein
VAQSTSVVDLLVWAAIAFITQMLAYGVATLMLPHLRRAIEDDQVASGILLTALSIAIGLLNAASMTV